jgi:recombination protein RecA
MYGEGVSRAGCVLDLAVEHGLVEKSGSHYSYNGEKIGNGRDNVKQELKENKPELLDELDEKVRAIAMPDKSAAIEDDPIPTELSDEELAETSAE